MARIVLVIVCGALVFILVSKFAPHFIETYLPGATSGSTTTASEAESSKKASTSGKKNTPAPKAKSGTAARSSSPAPAAPTGSEFRTPLASPPVGAGTFAQTAPRPAGVVRPVARVTAENATLYLTNTSVGPVVGRLTRGAVVEPLFVVNSAGQNWTFVNAGDQEIAGFMRSDNLRSDNLTKIKSAEPGR